MTLANVALSQSQIGYFRADYSIKEILGDTQNLNIGQVYYNGFSDALLYDQTFPFNQKSFFEDSLVYQERGDSINIVRGEMMFLDFSIYHLVINAELNDYGLKEKGYQMVKISNKDGKVYTKWQHPLIAGGGYVVISEKDQLPDGVVFYDNSGKVLMKQFFKDYQKIGRMMFPAKVYDLVESAMGSYKRITEHSNIKFSKVAYDTELFSILDDVSGHFKGK